VGPGPLQAAGPDAPHPLHLVHGGEGASLGAVGDDGRPEARREPRELPQLVGPGLVEVQRAAEQDALPSGEAAPRTGVSGAAQPLAGRDPPPLRGTVTRRHRARHQDAHSRGEERGQDERQEDETEGGHAPCPSNLRAQAG